MFKKVQFIGTAPVKWSISKPNQLVSGPGNMGKKEPIMPNNANKNPTIKRKISIHKFKCSLYNLKIKSN